MKGTRSRGLRPAWSMRNSIAATGLGYPTGTCLAANKYVFFEFFWMVWRAKNAGKPRTTSAKNAGC